MTKDFTTGRCQRFQTFIKVGVRGAVYLSRLRLRTQGVMVDIHVEGSIYM